VIDSTEKSGIQPMRINLGAGDRYQPGWWNVDSADSPHRKDEEVDLRGELPWQGVTHAYAGHILEHLFVGEALGLLHRLRGCMAPGGELMIVGPDVLVAQDMATAGTLNVTMDSLTNGGHRWPGDEHRWHCTAGDVEALLAATCWTNVSRIGINDVPGFWPVADRGPQWQCAVSAQP
jgi:predicted SAM-dependent methyltransferase